MSYHFITVAVILVMATPAFGQGHVDQKLHLKKVYVRSLLLGPEENGPAIRSGGALTTLVQALGAVDLKDDDLLPADAILHLRFQQPGRYGLSFRAAGAAEPLEASWPGCLQSEPYRPYREAFEAARRQALGEMSQGTYTPRSLDVLDSVVKNLLNEFEKRHPREVRTESQRSHSQYLECKRSLELLQLEVGSLRDVKGMTPSTAQNFSGQKVVELVRHMTHQALEFAPAFPQDEAAYYAVYNALANLCRKHMKELGIDGDSMQQTAQELASRRNTEGPSPHQAGGQRTSVSSVPTTTCSTSSRSEYYRWYYYRYYMLPGDSTWVPEYRTSTVPSSTYRTSTVPSYRTYTTYRYTTYRVR